MKVMLVFDDAYADRPEHELGYAFWIIDSPANRALANRVREASSTDPNSAVFKGQLPITNEDVYERVQDIDLHHPRWSEITVVGIEPTAELASGLQADGLSMVKRPDGFSIRRAGQR